MELSPTALALIGLLLAAWTVGAAVIMLRAARRLQRHDAMKVSLRRMGRMLQPEGG